MLNIDAYKRINGFSIESGNALSAVEVFGEPDIIKKTRLGKVEYVYNGNMYLRFSGDRDYFLECTISPGCDAKINDIFVTWDINFLRQLYVKNGGAKIAYGYIIFNNLGVAVTGVHDMDDSQKAVTIFGKNELNEFISGSEDYVFSN